MVTDPISTEENQNHTPAFLVASAHLHHLISIADDFVRSAELLYKSKSGSSEYLQSFHLLVSVAFELYPKVIVGHEVCLKHLKHENNIDLTVNALRDEIVKEQKRNCHNLKSAFEANLLLMDKLGIESISRVPENPSKEWFVSEYRFKIKDHPYLLSIKDVEAVRYGSFSSNQDLAISWLGGDVILQLLLKLKEFVREMRLETIQKMRQVI
ncbi:MAG: hypothetical protein NBV63_00745 [Candidatus Pacebacteria bacterium]|nr:hypothetical protein [Candidatus Paceibacterota bacterium]